jgi:tetratricopeptide (TPR) repeat protein
MAAKKKNPPPDRRSALLRILRATTTLPAQVTLYASALGAIALAAGADLPPVLAALAAGVGVNALSSVLERVARGDPLSDDEIRRQVHAAIDESGVAGALAVRDTQVMVAKLFRRLDLLQFIVQQDESAVLKQLTNLGEQHQTLFVELRDDLRAELEKLATREQGDEILELLRRLEPAPSFLHQLRRPPPDFTGRADELADLTAAVEREGVVISGLRGMGGVGKTALALKLAEQVAPRYPDAQFYLDLRGATEPLTPAQVMAHVVHGYHPTLRLPDDEAELAAQYRSVLHGQRALLLLDNAASRAQVEPLLPPPTCLLLVTSRQHFALPGLHARDLDVLPPADAEGLLRRIAPRVGDRAGELAELCGRLPLALTWAGSALAERVDLPLDDYVLRLQDARARLELVEASFSLSYDLLSGELRRLWTLLAVFPASFDRAAAAVVWELEPDPAQDGLSALARYSLVEWAEDRYRLHDLARLFADSRLGEEERACGRARHAAHYGRFLREANELYRQGGDTLLRGLALCDQELDNIRAGQAWAAEGAARDDNAARWCSEYPNAGAYCLDLRLHPREQVRWLEAALAAARRLGDRQAEGNALGSLGLAYWDLGDARRAIAFHEQALAIAREIGDRRGEGATLGNLGIAYAVLGDAHRAIGFHEQCLTITREIGDRRGEGQALGNLGIAYKDLGDAHRAIGFYEQRLDIAREIGDRRGEGNVLANMGVLAREQGDVARAHELWQQALAIYDAIKDPNAGRVRGWLDELRESAN